jgi:alkylated DNA repair protein (DNA oxidative demethylase)
MPIEVAAQVVLLHDFAQPTADYLAAVDSVAAASSFRRLFTPGGRPMSALMTNCGAVGWHSDARGYRYVGRDPQTDVLWPAMPECFGRLAAQAAAAAGYPKFEPDACLINRYEPGARMGVHHDADERDFTQPIVSVSLSAEATFLWYGERRAGAGVRIKLLPGDVLVWGGAARKGYHAVGAPKGGVRINLTFRKAL